ncbi:nucleoside-diphosphate-sugar epimerase [Thermoplasmatales archaeon SCGC AB-539-N05]|nr:nucleoside-diphosphate-sugar epimerase [Thermoplasmatales archaeon SCGC AB-539-N05]
MRGKHIIVTGGAGFIGSNLTRKLSENNKVVVVDDLSTGHFKNIQDLVDAKKIEFIKGSVTDIYLLKNTFKDADYVFHQAAIPSVPRSIKDPMRSNNVNINGTLNVLIAAKDNKIKKVVYASSSSAYGDTPTLPKKEDMTPCPLSPYAVSKLTGEYYCQVFTNVYGLSTISLRYFNVYGPRQDPSSEYAAVIPKFISRVLNGKPPLIYGDGKQTRDFTFIKDVVCANILAAETKATGIFNIAGGKRISINDLAKLIMKICGKHFDSIHDDPLPGDIKHSLADISKVKEKLGYEPKFNVSEGLEETIKWFQKQI